MSKKSLLSILVILALSLAGAVAAQQNPPEQGEEQGHRGMGGPPPVLGFNSILGLPCRSFAATSCPFIGMRPPS